jgi:hypothetical protein
MTKFTHVRHDRATLSDYHCRMATPVEVRLPGPAAPDEVARVSAALRAAGLRADEPSVVQQRSNTVVAVIIGVSLAEIPKAFAGEAGRDAYGALKRLVARLLSARGRADGAIVVRDLDGGATLALSSHLPDDAYARLAALDFSSLGEGDLQWDADTGRWQLVD